MLNYNKLKEIIKKRPVLSMAGIVVLVFMAWGAISFFTGEDALSSIKTYTVKQGPLKISITEAGAILPKEKIIIKNEVEGSTAITYLIDEASKVKKGDLMMELDSSALSDKKVDQEIQVQKATASNVEASENYEVSKNQAKSDIESAQLAYDFAQLDLKKYIGGEYPNSLTSAESNITVAEAEVAQAKDTLDWSKKLYEEKYLSEAELEKDTLSYTRKQLAVELKNESKDLLVNYTYKRQLAKLQSDVTQTKAALERTTRKAKANVVQSEAKKSAMQADYERQLARLEKYKNQLNKTKLYAPADGTIVYATSAAQSQSRRGSRTEPLKVGNSVQERQELIHLPTTSGFVVNVSIPEASIGKVKVGLPAQVTVSSIPNVIYTGTLTSVSNVSNAEATYMNSDLKVYDTVITLGNGGNMDLLHSGMSCSAEIIIDQYEKALYVPIEAVMSVEGIPTVYIVRGTKIKPRTVETGLDNNTVIRITSGLEPGDTVSLSPPLEEAAVVETSFIELSDVSSTHAADNTRTSKSDNQDSGSALSSASGVNVNNQESAPAEGSTAPATLENKKDSGNRYSTTGSIDDSSSSGGMPGSGGMAGGAMGGGGF
jgi:HlyD family secretion protein